MATAQTVQERISRQLGLMADSIEASLPEGSPPVRLLRDLAAMSLEPDEPELGAPDLGAVSNLSAAPLAPAAATNDAPEKKRTRSRSFSQRALARAMRAARAEGITARFEVVGDKIVIVPIGENEVAGNGAAEGDNPWDSVLDAAHQKRPS